MESTLYDILNLEKKATTQDIKQAYKKLAMKHHPDRGGDEDTFKQIGRAYDILSNDEDRVTFEDYLKTNVLLYLDKFDYY